MVIIGAIRGPKWLFKELNGSVLGDPFGGAIRLAGATKSERFALPPYVPSAVATQFRRYTYKNEQNKRPLFPLDRYRYAPFQTNTVCNFISKP